MCVVVHYCVYLYGKKILSRVKCICNTWSLHYSRKERYITICLKLKQYTKSSKMSRCTRGREYDLILFTMCLEDSCILNIIHLACVTSIYYGHKVKFSLYWRETTKCVARRKSFSSKLQSLHTAAPQDVHAHWLIPASLSNFVTFVTLQSLIGEPHPRRSILFIFSVFRSIAVSW